MTETAAVELWREPLAALEYARMSVAAERDLAKLEALKEYGLLLKAHGHARKLGAELQGDANEIINRSERRLGQLLAQTPKAKGNQYTGDNSALSAKEEPGTPRQQAGKKASAQSQQKAAMPEEKFEENSRRAPTRVARIARNIQAEQKRQDQSAAQEHAGIPGCDIRCGDFRTVLADITADAIITDPPYGKDYLPLMADLAKWADSVLVPGGVLAVLYGQTWLPEAMAALSGGRPYRWTACYLGLGNGYVSHDRQVNSQWKPVLIYGGGPRFMDVFRSGDLRGDAKQHHEWGQDIGGFSLLAERLTQPGQTVCDPFMGSGTSLLAAFAQGRHVVGCDIDASHVETARSRFRAQN